MSRLNGACVLCLFVLTTAVGPKLDVNPKRDVVLDLVKNRKIQENTDMGRMFFNKAAEVYQETGPARAIDMMERAVKAAPAKVEYRYLLGKYQHEAGIKRAAVYNLERTLSMNKLHTKAKKLLAEVQKDCAKDAGGVCLSSDGFGTEDDKSVVEPNLVLDIPMPIPLMKIHRFDIFTPEECETIIAAAKLSDGWASYGNLGSTSDLTLRNLPEDVYKLILKKLYDVLFPAICKYYEIDDESALKMESDSPFIVRYESKKSSGGMNKHKDNSYLSYIINLSPNDGFVGGGTHIYALNKTFSYDQGQTLVFPSQVLHAGVGITKGDRYIISGFTRLSDEYETAKKLLSYSTNFKLF